MFLRLNGEGIDRLLLFYGVTERLKRAGIPSHTSTSRPRCLLIDERWPADRVMTALGDLGQHVEVAGSRPPKGAPRPQRERHISPPGWGLPPTRAGNSLVGVARGRPAPNPL